MKRLFLILTLVLAACAAPAEQPKPTGETVYTIGWIGPLTGDGAVYGLPIERVTKQAVADLNEQWKAKNMRLEVLYEDGLCAGKTALTAAQKLVNSNNVKLIFGGICSGETLGVAPFTETNKVLLFSLLSSSPDVTNAGDYVFRNYPSDTAQVAVMTAFITEKGYKNVAILSENTDYAQALRAGYKESLPAAGVEIVADHVVDPESRDIRTEVAKIQNAAPDAVFLLPQTIPVLGIFAKQLFESGLEAQILGSDVLSLGETLEAHADTLEGAYAPRSVFEKEKSDEFVRLQEATDCELGFYCATTYDAVFLLGELLEACGDDADCMRDKLYATQGWEGMLSGSTSFDENGDVGGNFEVLQVVDGAFVAAE